MHMQSGIKKLTAAVLAASMILPNSSMIPVSASDSDVVITAIDESGFTDKYYGLRKADKETIIEALPKEVTVTTDDGNVIDDFPISTWECDAYNMKKAGDYSFMPVFADNVDTSKANDASVTVSIAKEKIYEFENLGRVYRYNIGDAPTLEEIKNNEADSLAVADVVSAWVYGPKDSDVGVNWSIDVEDWISDPEYDETQEGTYVFTPVIDEDSYIIEDAELPSFTVILGNFKDELNGSNEAKRNGLDAFDDDEAVSETGFVTSIDTFTAILKSGATRNNNGDYVWTPSTDASGHRFVFHVEWKTSGQHDIPAAEIILDDDGNVMDVKGGLQMKIPKSVLKDRNGDSADTYEMSIPSKEACDVAAEEDLEDAEYAYVELGDYIVIYNRKEVTAATSNYFEVSYVTDKKTFEYPDYDGKDDENWDDVSKDFYAELTAPGEKESLTSETNHLNVCIDTTAKLSYVNKKYPSQYSTWQSSWGEKPVDADNYYWQTWSVESYINKPTQRYNFTLVDNGVTATNAAGEKMDVEFYAYKLSGKSLVLANDLEKAGTLEDGQTSKNLSSDGYRYDTVITRLPKWQVFNRLKDENGDYIVDENGVYSYNMEDPVTTSYTIKNKVTGTVSPADEIDDDTIKTSTRTFSWTLPTFVTPSGNIGIEKYGDEWWGYYNAERYSYYDLDKFEAGSSSGGVDEIDDIYYHVSAGGRVYPWTLDGSATDPDAYGKKPVTYEIFDEEFYPLNEDGTQDVHVGNKIDGALVLDENGETKTVKRLAGTTTPSDEDIANSYKLEGPDYDIAYIKYSTYFQDVVRDENGNVVLNENTKNFQIIPKSFSEDDILYLYTKTGTDTAVGTEGYVLAGTYNLGTGELTKTEGSLIENMDSSTITFKKQVVNSDGTVTGGVDGFKVAFTNAYYSSSFGFYPYITIYATDNTRDGDSAWIGSGVVDGEDSTAKEAVILKNIARMNLRQGGEQEDGLDGKVFGYGADMVGDRLRVTQRSSSLIKKVTPDRGNNVLAKTYSLGWNVTAKETYTDKRGTTHFVKQDSGTFYDLLPDGAGFDASSLEVRIPSSSEASPSGWDGTGSYTTLSDADYSYELVGNYNGTKRTLLIVKINAEGYAYAISYKTIHAWDSINDYGTLVKNPVAYETGNAEISGGFPDNPNEKNADGKTLSQSTSTLTSPNTTYFTDLNGDGNAEAPNTFIYDEESFDIDTITAGMTNLRKHVMATSDKTWSYKTSVEPGEVYKYRLRYVSSMATSATNIILFDTLENFYLTKENKNAKESEWKGTLYDIDMSQLVATAAYSSDGENVKKDDSGKTVYLNPVLYVYTGDDLDLTTQSDLVDNTYDADGKLVTSTLKSSLWTKYEAGVTDLSKVTAIAIDCQKDTAGDSFTLNPGGTLTVNMYFKAPTEDKSGVTGRYPETYNNVYMQNTLVYPTGATYNQYIHHDYTIVKYHVTGSFGVHKISSESTEANEEVISGVEFRLFGTSDYGTEVDVKSTSNSSGNLAFRDIEKGTYTLQEYSPHSQDWLMDDTQYKVVIDEAGKVTIDGADYSETSKGISYIIIKNKPRVHADISLLKADSASLTTYLEGASYQLTGTSDYGTKISLTAETNKSGIATFKNIEKGIYKLKEITPPDNYILDTTEYKVTVSEDGSYAITKKGFVADSTTDFVYTGDVQTFEGKAGNSYILEVWGAQGGYRSSSAYGGKGGYSKGTLTLTEDTTLYIYAGGSGNTGGANGGFNGGGKRSTYNGGGGASDIRIGTDSLYARVIVAGGGGSDGASNKPGGAGGGASGISVSSYSYGTGGFGGTQTGNTNGSGYSASLQSTSTTSSGSNYAGFGFGGNGVNVSSGYGGAGGGGWYGGVGGYPDGSGDDDKGGGGGSGYIYTSDTAGTAESINGWRLDSSSYLTGAETIDGSKPFTAPDGSTETGHTGDGYARIATLVEIDVELPKVSGTYRLTDDKLRSVSFTKKDTYDNGALEGAEFTLTGISDLGTEVNKTSVSDSAGYVEFGGLESGKYILKETKAPEKDSEGNTQGYEENTGEYIVEVTSTGSFTISGAIKESSGNTIYNTRTSNAVVKVRKIWKDGNTSHKPEDLVMTVGQNVPSKMNNNYQIIFDAGDGKFELTKNGTTSSYDKATLSYNSTNKVTSAVYGNSDDTWGTDTPPNPVPVDDENYYFAGWSTDGGETVNTNIELTPNDILNTWLTKLQSTVLKTENGKTTYGTTLTAVYKEKPIVYYAVSIYGIGTDDVEGGGKGGLTFGPATGNMFSQYTNYNDTSFWGKVGNSYENGYSSPIAGKFRPMLNAHKVSDNTYTINDNSVEAAQRTVSEENPGVDASGIVITNGTVYKGTSTVSLGQVMADMAAVQNESEDAITDDGRNIIINDDGTAVGYVKTNEDGSAETSAKKADGFNAYRCVHYDNWNTIEYWNSVNPHVYDKCVENHCSKRLVLKLGENTGVMAFDASDDHVYNYKYGNALEYSVEINYRKADKYTISNSFKGSDIGKNAYGIVGDGASGIGYSQWNTFYDSSLSADDMYSASLIRGKLVGYENLISPKKSSRSEGQGTYYLGTLSWAGIPGTNVPATEEDSVSQVFKKALGENAIAKKALYDTYDYSKNAANTEDPYYDTVWLFDANEIFRSSNQAGSTVYTARKALSASGPRGSLCWWWLRSRCNRSGAWYVGYNGYYSSGLVNDTNSVAPGFILAR